MARKLHLLDRSLAELDDTSKNIYSCGAERKSVCKSQANEKVHGLSSANTFHMSFSAQTVAASTVGCSLRRAILALNLGAVAKGAHVWRGAGEKPLTSVRGRGHSSHLVCRTSGFLFLGPPPPSPSRLHGESLSLNLQTAVQPGWRAKPWLERFPPSITVPQSHSLPLAPSDFPPIPILPFNFSPSVL